MWKLYIIYSKKIDCYYTGVTEDFDDDWGDITKAGEAKDLAVQGKEWGFRMMKNYFCF
jgi:predicted GIY-YIG superfamily endonuclease